LFWKNVTNAETITLRKMSDPPTVVQRSLCGPLTKSLETLL